jgi:hypothetical protein
MAQDFAALARVLFECPLKSRIFPTDLFLRHGRMSLKNCIAWGVFDAVCMGKSPP